MWKILGIIFFFIIAAGLLWRFASERWRLPCPSWLGWMVEADNPFSKINRASSIIQKLSLQPGMKVIDIGCGPGRVTIPLARAVGAKGHVVALDIQKEMLEKVRKKAERERLDNISYLHVGVAEGKLPTNEFDIALLVTVIGEVPDQKRALQEIYNALKPGGVLSVTEIVFDPHYQRIAHVEKLAKDAGFQKIHAYQDRFAYQLLFQKPLSDELD